MTLGIIDQNYPITMCNNKEFDRLFTSASVAAEFSPDFPINQYFNKNLMIYTGGISEQSTTAPINDRASYTTNIGDIFSTQEINSIYPELTVSGKNIIQINDFFPTSTSEWPGITQYVQLSDGTTTGSALITLENKGSTLHGYSSWVLTGVCNNSYYTINIKEEVIQKNSLLKRADLNLLAVYFAFKIICENFFKGIKVKLLTDDKSLLLSLEKLLKY